MSDSPHLPEPMPWLRAMAIVRWLILAAVAATAATTVLHYGISCERATEGPARFHCPMHPEIVSAKPGTCPICHMNLEPITEGRTGTGGTGHDGGSARAGDGGSPPAPMGRATVEVGGDHRLVSGIATAIAETRFVARELRLSAVVEAREGSVTEVRVRTPGFVEHVAPIETGSRVRRGDVMLRVYSPELLRAQEELLTALRLTRAPTVEPASGTGSPPTGRSLLASGDTEVAAAARERLSLLGMHARDLDRLLRTGHAERVNPVRAPASGFVTERSVSVGAQATPDMTLFRITDLSTVWVTTIVPSGELAMIAPHSVGRFVGHSDDRARDVEAVLIEPHVSAETRTGRIRFAMGNQDLAKRPGDLGEVTVSLAARPYLVVPRDAVIDVGSTWYVFVESSPGTFAPRSVTPGPLLGEHRVIVAGLDEGARVVSRGAFLLDSESRLRATLSTGTAGDPPPPPDHAHGSEVAP